MFLIPHLLLEYLMILKLIIPQMCPNFVRMVNGLITLSREQRFIVMDLHRSRYIAVGLWPTPALHDIEKGVGSTSSLLNIFPFSLSLFLKYEFMYRGRRHYGHENNRSLL